jgi:DNA-binding PadR family transcriptional regulator
VKQLTETLRKELVQRIVRNLLDIQILRLIQTEPMWGYKIKKQVAEKYDVKLRHGGLYPLLKSLEEKGFITSQRQQQKGRTRKTYTITEKGEQYVNTYHKILKEQIESKDLE